MNLIYDEYISHSAALDKYFLNIYLKINSIYTFFCCCLFGCKKKKYFPMHITYQSYYLMYEYMDLFSTVFL